MCELLVATFDEARPFADIAPIVSGLEQLGLAGFGWGVGWLDEDDSDGAGGGSVHGIRGLGRFREEGYRNDALMARASRRFVCHLRRPRRLSTVQMADTQPFFDGDRSAWCHNGYLERANEVRDQFASRLHGRADSEVGWVYFLERLAAGDPALDAMRAVDAMFGGRVNLAYLASDGELSLYSRNDTNGLWTFDLDGGVLAATDLHSDDDSLFDLVVPRATNRERLDQGTAIVLAGSAAPMAT
jgi:predicted glutamine amidotransferase